jgi:hypothetical protein
MTREDFIDRIRIAIFESAINGTRSLLIKPPGRRPSEKLNALSQWYHLLSSADKENLLAVIQLAVRNSVFNMLTILDGVKSIRREGEGVSSLELWHKSELESTLINGQEGEFLHDIFSVVVPPS